MDKMFKTVKMFSRNSVFFKTLKKFIWITILPFLIISASFSLHYYHTLKAEYTALAVDDFMRMYRTFDRLLSSTDHVFYTLCSEPPLDAFFSMPDPTIVNAQDYAQLIRLRSQLNTQAAIFEPIRSIQLYRNTGYVLSSSESGYLANPFESGAPAGLPVSMSFLLPRTITAQDGKTTETFAVCYNYYHAGQQCGYVVLNIDAAVFLKELPPEYVLSIFNAAAAPVFSSSPDVISDCAPCTSEGESPAIRREDSILHLSSCLGDNCLYLYTKNKPGMHISSIIYTALLCSILSFLTAFLLALVVSMDSYHMLQNIIFSIDACDEVGAHQHASINELTYISDNIIQMHTKNQSLETVLAGKMNEMRQMQNAMLQMQFTPHFLFNTLNAVNLIALRKLGPENEIERITILLCDLLSQALNTNRYIITVEEELEYTKKYIEIEEIKSKNSFDTHWDIDSAILTYNIPKLILQPIVENSFRHGIKYLPPERRGKLTITGRETDTDILFEIQDNGKGISPEKLRQLQEQLQNDTIRKNHVGLVNVNSRIRLFFGDAYGLQIIAQPGNTTIQIKIPKTKYT